MTIQTTMGGMGDYEIPDKPFDWSELVDHASRLEQQVCDAEARALFWKRVAKRYWKDHKMVVAQVRPWFDRTNAAEAEAAAARVLLHKAGQSKRGCAWCNTLGAHTSDCEYIEFLFKFPRMEEV